MNRILAVLLAVVLVCPVNAQQLFVAHTGNGVVQLSLGAGDEPMMFSNFLQSSSSWKSSSSTDPYPQELDANGYPNNIAGGGALPYTVYGAVTLPSNYYAYTWVVDWQGSCGTNVTAGLELGAGGSVMPRFTILSGSSFVVGSSNDNLSLGGTNGYVTFTLANQETGAPGGLAPSFLAGATFSGCTNWRLYRATDAASLNAGNPFTPEMIAALEEANPLAIRTMGMNFDLNANRNNFVDEANAPPATVLSYMQGYWVPNLWAGSTTGTDQYAIGAASSTPPNWTNGEEMQAFIPNASAAQINASAAASDSGIVQLTVNATAALTTNQQVLVGNCQSDTAPLAYVVTVIDGTHIDLQGTTYGSSWSSCTGGIVTTTTININNRGAKFVVNDTGLGAPAIAADSLGTFVYDGVLNEVLYFSGAQSPRVPLAVLVQLANAVSAPLWFNFAPHIDNASVGDETQYINFHAKFGAFFELGNEWWNYVFPQAQWGTQRGYALGLPLGGNQALLGFVGLRYRQVMGIVTADWTGSASLLHRVNCWQESGTPSQFNNLNLLGTELCGTSCGNSAYQSLIGIDYDSSPNRPGDYTDGSCIALYFNGAQAVGSATNSSYGGNTLADITDLINAATEWADGDTADAYAFLDSDYRNGSGGSATASTLYYVAHSLFPTWVSTIADNWPSMKLYAYEGALQAVPPTATWLENQGDENYIVDAANINSLITAYRTTHYAFQIANDYCTQFLNAGTNVAGCSWLSLEGSSTDSGGQWSLLPGYVIPTPFSPYEMYYGICYLNNNSVCHQTGLHYRDLPGHPANDDRPVGLDMTG